MEKSFHNFRTSIFPYANAIIIPVYIIFIPLWIIRLVFIDVESSPELSSFVLLYLLGCLAVAYAVSALLSFCKVQVSQDGISGFNFWGGITRRAFVRWDEIEEVRPIRFFGLRYLRLFCKSIKKPLWIPLFLNNVNEFQKLVIQYSNEGNDIRGHLDESNKYRLPGLRKNLVRLIAVLVIPFLIYGASVVFYFSKAPIKNLVLRSAYSEYLVEAIPIPTLPPSLCRFYIRNFSDFDINEKYDGLPLLHWALLGYVTGDPDQRQHMLNLSEFFIAKGADLNALDKWGRTCLHLAVRNNSPELARFLLKHGADINVPAGSKLKNLTPLAYARSLKKEYPRTDRREVIQLLIQNGAIE